ncbi:MAG: hypothetical protein FWF69_06680 [Firmicutes bacterium]|nr:hypothetical protein [Bacillota bacterium]
MATTTIQNPARETRKNVGGVEYIIRSFFKEDACETAEQKLLRLVRERVAVEVKSPENQGFSST